MQRDVGKSGGADRNPQPVALAGSPAITTGLRAQPIRARQDKPPALAQQASGRYQRTPGRAATQRLMDHDDVKVHVFAHASSDSADSVRVTLVNQFPTWVSPTSRTEQAVGRNRGKPPSQVLRNVGNAVHWPMSWTGK